MRGTTKRAAMSGWEALSEDELARCLHQVDAVVPVELAIADPAAAVRDEELGVRPHQDLVLAPRHSAPPDQSPRTWPCDRATAV